MKIKINLSPREKLIFKDIESKIRSAKNGSDYILVNFGTKGQFIKIAFSKDNTYTIRT